MKEYKVTVKVSNNYLKTKMDEFGIENVSELSRQTNINVNTLQNCMNLKHPLYTVHGKIATAWIELADFFGCSPFDLIPKQHHTDKLKRNSSSFELYASEIDLAVGYRPSSELQLATSNARSVLLEELSKLGSKDIMVVVETQYKGYAPNDVARKLNVTNTRINQRVDNSFYKLKTSEKLRAALDLIKEAQS